MQLYYNEAINRMQAPPLPRPNYKVMRLYTHHGLIAHASLYVAAPSQQQALHTRYYTGQVRLHEDTPH